MLLLLATWSRAQTLGGAAAFNFLKLSPTPQLTALGGVNVSQTVKDVGLAFNNPALLTPEMHTHMNAAFNDFYAGIEAYQLSLAYHHKKLNTRFLWGVHYLSYGEVTGTDASGNLTGSFRATDWVMQLSAARDYLEKWHYGATIKFISSNYGQFRSSAVAVDMGVLFHDSSKLFSASILAKNMGLQLSRYAGAGPEELPFDLQAGITKRLADAPLAFSITAHSLHQFDITYNDAGFNDENGFPGQEKGFSFDRVFRHFVFAAQVYAGKNIELTAGYNHLRRKELNIGEGGNGLNGFSLGVGLLLKKMQVRYARSHYQRNSGYNQLGLNLKLNEYFGLGRFGERIGW